MRACTALCCAGLCALAGWRAGCLPRLLPPSLRLPSQPCAGAPATRPHPVPTARLPTQHAHARTRGTKPTTGARLFSILRCAVLCCRVLSCPPASCTHRGLLPDLSLPLSTALPHQDPAPSTPFTASLVATAVAIASDLAPHPLVRINTHVPAPASLPTMKEVAAAFAPSVDVTRSFVANLKNKMASSENLSFAVKIDSRSVSSIIKSRVMATPHTSDPDAEDAFYVGDLGEITRQHAQWKEMLPRVEPFYAVKCNPDMFIIKTLAALGTGFDCASKAEIDMVLEQGVDSSRVIYANPCKQASHIRHAGARGVRVMTFDNADELHKVKSVMPDAKMVLRILTDDSRSICRFGVKFGASLATVPMLLRTAKELDIDVIGISFHVGSGCFDAGAFGDAVALARKAFDIGAAYGFDFKLLDIGGGFPGRSSRGLQFEEIANVLRPAIDALFPEDVRVIAEPGRYFASSAFTLAVNIVARRVVPRDTSAAADNNSAKDEMAVDSNGDHHPSYMYYINDGMYGSFNCLTFDHAVVEARPLVHEGEYMFNVDHDLPTFPCSIWGPTCDSIDCITREASLPQMKVGDWLYFANMGAYTMAAARPTAALLASLWRLDCPAQQPPARPAAQTHLHE
ncbi:pyridoxal-dependent decarboxylase [Entophlyctis helioformis]|nr:pyridoxal-dependent decarboxylase [Entophlyctis helioformis]